MAHMKLESRDISNVMNSMGTFQLRAKFLTTDFLTQNFPTSRFFQLPFSTTCIPRLFKWVYAAYNMRVQHKYHQLPDQH